MKNSYQKFLESFLDEFSKTSSINSVTEKTDDLFAEIVERQSTSIFNRIMEKEGRSWDAIASMKPKETGYLGQRAVLPDEIIGDVVQKFDSSTWGDMINFDDKHLGQVVQHKKTNRRGVVIRSDSVVHRTSDDGVTYKDGRKLRATGEVPSGLTGWETGRKDPVDDRSVMASDTLKDHGPFGDVRVAILRPDGSINPRGKLQFWFAQDYEPTGEQVDVPKLLATAKRTDKVHNRAASWKSKSRKAMPAIRYQRAEDGSWELANPQDFDEKTRAELIAKMDQLPDEISAEELERWRKREEARQIEKNARDSGLISQYMNYGDEDGRLDPDL